VYDAAIAGKQAIVQKSAGHADRNAAARMPVRICWPGKEQCRPVWAGVIVLLGVSSKAPGVQHSSKVQVSQDIKKMMGTPPLPGRDISSSISKAS
jgi:hypothetical protein